MSELRPQTPVSEKVGIFRSLSGLHGVIAATRSRSLGNAQVRGSGSGEGDQIYASVVSTLLVLLDGVTTRGQVRSLRV